MKYTVEELRYMARDYLQAKECGDMRCGHVVMALCMHFGMSPAQCESMIASLAA
jgi:hypothetical protein